MNAFRRVRRIPATLMAELFIVIFFVAAYAAHVADAAPAGTGDTGKSAQTQTDFQRLEGKWVRPDGGYVLELRNIKMDGSLTAAYYNPRPIRVYRAEASKKNNQITVIVELRDVNYPGSTYTLQYDPATDRLKGKYFQAVERQTFDIEFVRVK